MTAKVLLQDLCIERIGWNDPTLKDKIEVWIDWLGDLEKVQSIRLPRYLYDKSEGKLFNFHIHGFGDASSKVYFTVIYLVYQTKKKWKVDCCA